MPRATLTVYYDYTCRYSYRALHWLDLIPGLSVEWRTFSLKEVNRAPEEPSWLSEDAPPSISVLALGLAHAAREADFERYHRAVFEAMHGEERKLDEPDLLKLAAEAGVDASAFARDRGSWTARAGEEHHDAVERLGAYGTPTLVFDDAAAYVRLTTVPESADHALDLIRALDRISSSEANLVEMFRPAGPRPTLISLPETD